MVGAIGVVTKVTASSEIKVWVLLLLYKKDIEDLNVDTFELINKIRAHNVKISFHPFNIHNIDLIF